MAFNSIGYLYFLCIAVFAYHALPRSLKISWLVACSYFFYAQWNHFYLILIIASTCIDYSTALAIDRHPQKRKVFLWLSILTNLSILFTFKYLDFFSSIANDLSLLMNRPLYLPILEWVVPVGISFYTFQTMSYTMDVYRGKLKAEQNFLRFAAYVSCFPQLVAGPIERATHLLPQMKTYRKLNYDDFISGSQLIVWGLFKKVVVADRLSLYVQNTFEHSANPGNWQVLISGVFANILIYADFSAYADIAIGSARLLGIDLRPNFRFPMFSTSMPDFWKRWHISLHKWFLDYIYWPIGGSKVSWGRWMFNITVIFIISGLWHGAAWNFVVWSIFHLSLVLIHIHVLRFWNARNWPQPKGLFFTSIQILFVQFQRGLSMILFFVTDMEKNIRFFKSFFQDSWKLIPKQIFPDVPFITIILLSGVCFLLLAEALHLKKPWPQRLQKMPMVLRFSLYYFIAFVIMVFGVETNNPFIYFQF